MNGKVKKLFKISALVLAIILGAFFTIVLLDLVVGLFGVKRNVDFYKSVKSVGCDTVIEEDSDGNFTLLSDEEIKILQLSDTHIGGGAMSANEDTMALKAIVNIVSAVKPDLIVVTGDLTFSYPLMTANRDNLKSLKMLAKTFEALEIYWCPVFGNHDAEDSRYTKQQLGDYLESLNYCVFSKGLENIDGVGNYVVNVKNSAGVITQTLFFMDSNEYVTKELKNSQTVKDFEKDFEPTKYDNVHKNQIEWYESKINEYSAQNAQLFAPQPKSLLFIHIPFVQYVQAFESQKSVYGALNEKTCYGVDYGFFDKIKALGSTQGVFVGHDHVNDASVEYEGVRLTYTPSIDYLAYVQLKFTNKHRGGTVITLSASGAFDCEAVYLKNF